MKRNSLKKRTLTLIFLSLIFLISISAYARMLVNNGEYKVSFSSPYTDDIPVINDVQVTKYDYKKEIDSLREYYHNDDIIGKLVIDDTDINEPILKGSDNSYYLNHNAYGEYQAEGSVYMDYRTNIGDKKALIFGHSSPGWDVPFNELEKYYEKSFYDNHKFIRIYSDDGVDTYEIFSVHVETSDFTYMNIMISDDVYNEYLKKYQSNSMYKTDVSVGDGDNILILQTCSNHPNYSNYRKKFLLVIGKKINKEENK